MSHHIADLISSLATVHRDTPAMISGDRQILYSELPKASRQFAAVLAKRGLQPHDRIGIAMRDGLDFMQAICAIWTLGAIPVPMDFRSTATERGTITEEFGLTTILEDRHLIGAIYSGTHWHDDVVSSSTEQEWLVDLGSDAPSTAVISLTSGTTGRPIGIVLDHSALVMRAFGYSFEGISGRVRVLNVYPLSFSAMRNHTLGHLLRGSTIIFKPPLFSASELIDWVLTERASFAFMVEASVKGILAEAPATGGPLFPDLQVLYCGGSGMLASDKVEAAQRLSPGFLHCFSSSLSGTCSSLTGADLIERADTDGRIVPHARVEIVDEDDQLLPADTPGLLRVRTPGMASGFYANRSRPEGDRIKNGWAYTGDLGTISADGFLTIVGRTSDMILRGGANIYPAEVENVLNSLPGILDVAVVGIPHDVLGEDIAAFLVTDGTVSEDEVRAACQQGLSPDKRPRHIVFQSSLPRNPNGKVLKRELREHFQPGAGE